MNREIKFRAWDFNKKRFVYFPLHPQRFDWGDTRYNRIYEDINGYMCGISFPDIEYWQQYTGLKDKNGKGIYEGDILLVDDHRLVKIYWFDLGGSWDVAFISDKYIKSEWVSIKPSAYNVRAEVIGNIYEDPKLLK